MIAMLAATLTVLAPGSPAGAAPVVDVVIGAGRNGVGAYTLQTWRPAHPVITDTDNFGPSGTVVLNSLEIVPEVDEVSSGFLGTLHIFFDAWVTEAQWSAAELDAIDDWVTAGGVLITNEDQADADSLATMFGLPVAGSRCCDIGVITPVDTGHPIVDGPFGAWTEIDPGGTLGHFGPTAGITAPWSVVAEDENDNAVILTRTWGDGHVILTSDEGFFREDEEPSFSPGSQNAIFTLNTIAYAISLTDDGNVLPFGVIQPGDQVSLVGSPDGLTPGTGGGDGTAVTWEVTGLPSGLSMPDPNTGVISGTPDTIGTSSVTLTATQSGVPDAVTFDWVVNGPLSLTDPGDQSGSVGAPITPLMFTTSGGDGEDIDWSADVLPAGLSISASTGTITGTPTTAGTTTVTVTADQTTSMDSVTFDWVIDEDLVITPIADQNTLVGTLAELQVEALGGDGTAITYGASGLPTGLGIDPNSGLISGTPTTLGTTTVTVTATQSGVPVEVTFDWTITANLVPVATADTGSGTVGEPFALDICENDTEGEGTNTVTIVDGNVPPGLALNGCVLSGTPTDAGQYAFAYTLTDEDADESDPATVTVTFDEADPSGQVECNGVLATIVGTAGPDEIDGTPGPDVIHGLGGDDIIHGLDGDDLICGGGGADEIHGDRGTDTIYGNGGGDTLFGNGGGDNIFGQGGPDTITGGGGADTIFGGGKSDTVSGGNGNDVISGGRGNDSLSGNRKADTILGNRGRDRLWGNAGPDVLNGGPGRDRCRGGKGADKLESC